MLTNLCNYGEREKYISYDHATLNPTEKPQSGGTEVTVSRFHFQFGNIHLHELFEATHLRFFEKKKKKKIFVCIKNFCF